MQRHTVGPSSSAEPNVVSLERTLAYEPQKNSDEIVVPVPLHLDKFDNIFPSYFIFNRVQQNIKFLGLIELYYLQSMQCHALRTKELVVVSPSSPAALNVASN